MTSAAADNRNAGLLGMIPLAGRRRSILLLTIFAGVVAQAAAVTTLVAGGWIVGQALIGAPAAGLVPAFWLLLALVLATGAARWWQAHVAHHLAFSLIEVLQVGVYDGLERSAPGFILGRRSGELAGVANADTQLMEFFFAHTLGDYVAATVVPLGALAALAFVQPLLALALLPFLPLLASIPFWLARRAGEQGRAVSATLGALNADVVEAIQGQRDLAIFGQGPASLARLAARTEALGAQQRVYGARSGLEQAAIELIMALAVVTAAWVSGALYADHRMGLEFIPVAVILAGAALGPVIDVTQTARKLGELRAGAERILAIFHQPPNVADKGISSPSADLSVGFRNVGFAYPGASEAALTNVSFTIAQGTTVALVGRSGAGKSTCANLLMRFWDPASGSISIGGNDISALPIATLRRLVTIVSQDAYLFDESVADNIRLGRPEATPEEVARAARLAQAHDFIEALPQGYETRCGERGARLSGGQRQRIAIARALLHDAPILIMDEAVSNLDTENERALHAAMAELRRDRIILLIAHRPSTIATADQVLVLQDGAIAEQGTPAELMAKDSLYARILAMPENS